MGARKATALCLGKDEWDRIRCGLQWSRDAEIERAEAYRAHKEKLRLTSKEMSKHWAQNVESAQQKRLEAARQRAETLKKERDKWLEDIRRIRAKEIKTFLEHKQKLMFYEKDSIKELNSALLLSEVLKERNAQINFQTKLQQMHKEDEDQYNEEQKRILEKYEAEEKEVNMQQQKRIIENSLEMRRQFHESMRKKHEKEEQEKEMERKDLENMDKQEEEDRKARIEEENKKRQGIKYCREESLKQKREQDEKIQMEEKQLEKVVDLYANAKRRMECTLKKKQKEMRDAKLKKFEQIAKLVARAEEHHEEIEEAILKKALAEAEAKYTANREKKKKYYEQLVEARKRYHEEYLQAEEEKKKKEQSIKKWDQMQSVKQQEVNDKFEEEKKKKDIESKLKLRKEYHKQMVTNQEQKKKELDEEKQAVKDQLEMWRIEDSRVLNYAKELIEESKKKERPLLPLLKVVEKQKKHLVLGPEAVDETLKTINLQTGNSKPGT